MSRIFVINTRVIAVSYKFKPLVVVTGFSEPTSSVSKRLQRNLRFCLEIERPSAVTRGVDGVKYRAE